MTNSYQIREELMNQLDHLYPNLLTSLLTKVNPSYSREMIPDNEKIWNILKSALLKNEEQRTVYRVNENNVDEVLYGNLKLLLNSYEKLENERNERDIKDNLDYKYWNFYIPLCGWVIEKAIEKKKKYPDEAYVLGINGGQGSGKSTIVAFLKLLLEHQGYKVVTFSSDDFYKTHEELLTLKQKNPVYKARGPPGTHDTKKFKEILEDLKNKRSTKIPKYDKSAYNGKGDRNPGKDWKKVPEGADIVIVEGALMGLRPISKKEELCKPSKNRILNRIEQRNDPNCIIRETFNEATKDYVEVSELLDNLIGLDVSLGRIRKGRREQEKKLIKTIGKGMSPEKLEEFMDYYALFYRIILHLMKSEYIGLRVKIGNNYEVKKVIQKCHSSSGRM
jgi:D-glycerate 3-kinase